MSIISNSSFESQLFFARRLAGIPGYQYKIDETRELRQRQIFAPGELSEILKQCKEIPGHQHQHLRSFVQNLYVIEVNRGTPTERDGNGNGTLNWPSEWKDDVNLMMKHLVITHPDELSITLIDEAEPQKYYNDCKFKELTAKDRRLVKFGLFLFRLSDNRITKRLCESVVGTIFLRKLRD